MWLLQILGYLSGSITFFKSSINLAHMKYLDANLNHLPSSRQNRKKERKKSNSAQSIFAELISILSDLIDSFHLVDLPLTQISAIL